jgi:hypothetical protein
MIRFSLLSESWRFVDVGLAPWWVEGSVICNWCWPSKAQLFSLIKSQSQSYITTDSQSVSPSSCQAPIWDPQPIFPILFLIIFFRQFRVCWCGAPSLTRSRVCSFQFLPGITSAAFLRSESRRTHEHSLLSLFLRLAQPGGPGTCIYFTQEQGSPVYRRTLGSLSW